jgi:DNA-binding MarR family transcriptional regulator
MQQVSRQSEGRYKLGPGTLYDNLQRLLNQGLVQERGHAGGDSRRRYYKVTALGRGVLAAEVSRLESMIRDAKLHLQTGPPGKGVTMRILYAFLLRLHPRRFRERFAEEMMAIFEEAASLGFSATSCGRSWFNGAVNGHSARNSNQSRQACCKPPACFRHWIRTHPAAPR